MYAQTLLLCFSLFFFVLSYGSLRFALEWGNVRLSNDVVVEFDRLRCFLCNEIVAQYCCLLPLSMQLKYHIDERESHKEVFALLSSFQWISTTRGRPNDDEVTYSDAIVWRDTLAERTLQEESDSSSSSSIALFDEMIALHQKERMKGGGCSDARGERSLSIRTEYDQ